ncbi:unnamed protein product [Agarophyton chilense]|eukprot:gb/GEZJ01000907.1/.p1 GENE.gb/GEZJ01000907.1/~~gb/GEZJ01000907.1/.p1  ORF type:complete len:468 (+),score=65.36 gb/GEZJ01000907.1/:408-1811(+)
MHLELVPPLGSDLTLNDFPNDFLTPASSPPPSTPPLLRMQPLASPPSLGRRRLDAFHIVCLIGKGGFGKVFMVRHKATAAVYAMKVMEKDALISRKAVQDAHTERNILALVGQYDAPFIIRLHVAFQTSKRVYLVMDFASGGELMFHLRREAMLSETQAKFYAAELLIALETLHNMHIVHRDIKPENVLLDSEGHLILTDFGLAKELSDDGEQTHSWCGSEDYMAPEIITRDAHCGKAADYWAYGIFIYDCLCGQPPFSPLHEKGKLSRKRLHERIVRCKYKLPKYLTSECQSLIRKFLTKDVTKRLTDPEAIRRHAWFRDVDWEAIRNRRAVPPIIPSQSSPTACFSPSLTKAACAAPVSPPNVYLEARSSPIMIANSTQAAGSDSMWQGFSFVAPGMEVHFELAPAVVMEKGDGGGGGAASAAAFEGEMERTQQCDADVEESLVAELAEFSIDAASAVEIVDGDV